VLARGTGAVLGLVIGVLLANRFGAGSAADAFFFARRLTTGATESLKQIVVFVYVPSLVANLRSRGGFETGRLWFWSMARGLAVAVLATGLLTLVAPWLVSILAPGFDPARHELATLLLRILLVLIPAGLILAGIASLLFASRTFGRAELAAIVPRLLVVVLLMFFIPPLGVSALCWALSGGTLLAALALIISQRRALRGPALRSAVFAPNGPSVDIEPERPRARESLTGGRVLPLLVMNAFRVGATWIDLAIASTLFVGAVSVLEYAHRLVYLASSVLAASVITVMYTEFAHEAAEADVAGLRRRVAATQRAGLFLLLPFLAFLLVTADALVHALLLHGAFDAYAAERTATVGRYYTLVFLTAYFVNTIVTGIYTDSTAPRLRIVGWIAATGLATRLAAVFPLASAYDVVGIAMADLLSSAVVLVLTVVLVGRHWGGLLEGSDLRAGAKMLLCALLAFGAMRAGLLALPSGGTILVQLGTLAGLGLAGATVYLGAAAALGVPEISTLRAAVLLRRAKRSG